MNKYTSSRRYFVKTSTVLTAGSLLTVPFISNASPKDKVLKIGLVGIGGRGSGAAAQAMNADENVALTAIGDLFEDRIKLRSRILKARGRDKFQVTPETSFAGFDAYKKVIDSGFNLNFDIKLNLNSITLLSVSLEFSPRPMILPRKINLSLGAKLFKINFFIELNDFKFE